MGQIQTKKLAEVIAEQLESMLIDGQLLPGQRLPSERELAAQFAVSRPSLREAILTLVSKGLLYRKQGGGTYVAEQLTPQVTDPLMQLVAARPEGQFDLLEFRHALEGMAAYYAALRGSEDDCNALKSAFKRVQNEVATGAISDLAKELADFYLCMAKGSHNMVLSHVMGNLMSLLKENIEANLKMLQVRPDACEKIHKQREVIVSAIVAGNPEKARHASNEHLAFIEQTLLEINRQDSRMQRALRRIEITKE
ncbi:GntR family transcriptional regulator [Paraneptunicella aestuarii]|uniref:GntR family transcriptional regulator n=1 Tax=Paraneptunicella aestuarii TaxID=2831148 RepID=UPI001E2F242C|nr:GntR family transcriptional regulator [Paraneptunicella aestuarii]UAA38070.1 GntR family transcriptional regulator [Paraneptunicella aestuarii]